MRRLLAILLVALFGLTTAAPLLAATLETQQDRDAHLPACCRRNGAHHCMMLASTDAPAISMRCSEAPRQPSVVPYTHLSAFAAKDETPGTYSFLITPVSQAEQQLRLTRERSRHKRGPPATPFAA